jgi:hypothetical protein
VDEPQAHAEMGRRSVRDRVRRLDRRAVPLMPSVHPELRMIGGLRRQQDDIQLVAGQEVPRPPAMLPPLRLDQPVVSPEDPDRGHMLVGRDPDRDESDPGRGPDGVHHARRGQRGPGQLREAEGRRAGDGSVEMVVVRADGQVVGRDPEGQRAGSSLDLRPGLNPSEPPQPAGHVPARHLPVYELLTGLEIQVEHCAVDLLSARRLGGPRRKIERGRLRAGIAGDTEGNRPAPGRTPQGHDATRNVMATVSTFSGGPGPRPRPA